MRKQLRNLRPSCPGISKIFSNGADGIDTRKNWRLLSFRLMESALYRLFGRHFCTLLACGRRGGEARRVGKCWGNRPGCPALIHAVKRRSPAGRRLHSSTGGWGLSSTLAACRPNRFKQCPECLLLPLCRFLIAHCERLLLQLLQGHARH